MRHIPAIIFLGALALTSCAWASCSNTCTNTCYCTYGKTWFSQRNQGSNEYLVLSLTADKRHLYNREEIYGDVAVTPGWQQNFDRSKLSSYFMNKNGNMLVGANNTAGVDVRASDLGLSTTFTGCASLCPKYSDFIADFDLYIGWDKFVHGLWAELRVPFVHTRWNSGLTTQVTAQGGTFYTGLNIENTPTDHWVVTGYTGAGDEGTPVPVVYTGTCALSGALLGDKPFGNAPKLAAGKITTCTRSANGLGDVRLSLGWDFVRRERGNLGLALDIGFPVANKLAQNTCCCDQFIFSPSVGSQHAWMVGGIARGQYRLWAHENKDSRVDLFVDTRAYGLLNGQTTRLLGLATGSQINQQNCPTTLFNQYLLLKKYSANGQLAKYEGLERAANLLKARVKYCNAICEGQATVMLQYQHNGFVGALGYNFFGRGAEKLKLCSFCNPTGDYLYVIKGPALVYDNFTLCDGGFYSPTDSSICRTGAIVPESQTLWNAIPLTVVQANAIKNFSLCPAQHPRYISNTLFANVGYNWFDHSCEPYIGLVGKVDFGSQNTALNLWGLYLKGGLCF